MQWFGNPQGFAYEADTPRVPTPVGKACDWCLEPIVSSDYGVLLPALLGEGPGMLPYHHACHLRTIVGGLNHLQGKCLCCGGSEPPDPPELTLRMAAAVAVGYWQCQQAFRCDAPAMREDDEGPPLRAA